MGRLVSKTHSDDDDDSTSDSETSSDSSSDSSSPEPNDSPSDSPDIPTHATPTTPSICSPQLLHLSRSGTPLWFNGWVASQKFDNPVYDPFDVYMAEPAGLKDVWKLKESNIACLWNDVVAPFSDVERDVLEGLVASAKVVRGGWMA
jgi:hypothetical protein